MRSLLFLILGLSIPSFGETLPEIAAFSERVQSFAAKDLMLYNTSDDNFLLRITRLRSYPPDKQFYFWRHGSAEVTVPDTIYFWGPDALNFYLLNLLDYNQAVGSLPTAQESVIVDNHDLNSAKYARLTASRGGYELECRGGDGGNKKLMLFKPYAQVWKRSSMLSKARYVPPPAEQLLGELVLSFQRNKKTHYVIVGYQRFNLKPTTEVRSLASEKRRVFDNVHVLVGEPGKLVDWKHSTDEATGTYDGPNGSMFMNPVYGKISMPNDLAKWKATLVNPDGTGEIFALKREELLSGGFLGLKADSPYTRVNKEILEKLKTVLGKEIARFTPQPLPFPCH